MKNDHLFNEKQPFFRCVSISRTRCVSNGHLTQYFVKNIVEKYEYEYVAKLKILKNLMEKQVEKL